MTYTPTHIVYHVKDAPDDTGQPRGFWTKIGAAWSHKDEKGFSITLDGLLPLDGRLLLREAGHANDQAAGAPEDDAIPADLPI